ncbi:PLAT/LH2 domain-containing protein [Streptomyces sp. SBC-4]|nr:PLAT/LH2 domain-containing protein [Streptomyces sp. SBC-4]MDV5147408.1 PLAT/LH2 domain-containing protein [Streptomyces sp. SBC-4]
MPRIYGDEYAPGAGTVLPEGPHDHDHVRRGGRRAPKVIGAAVVLAACTAGGIAIGVAATADPARPAAAEPPAAPAPSRPPVTTAPEPSGPAAYQVTLETADAEGAGTDSDVQGRLTDEAGRTSAWTVLDTDGQNDFEADTRTTYVIDVPAAFGRPASLQLWKGGKDAWAVESGARITGPDGYSALWHPTGTAPHLWITGGDVAPDDGSPVFTEYSPNGTLAGERT